MAKWYGVPKSALMSEGEYDANIQGINIVFGAVLGFVLADANQLPAFDFALVLFVSASVVVSILYMANSEYKLFYAALTAFVIFMLPTILEDHLDIPQISQLQPTLAVWAVMILMVALLPRGDPPEDEKEAKEQDK